MVDPSDVVAVERLIADLNALRRQSGNPSLGRLAALSGRELTTSTLHDHLTGRRPQLPRWELVSAYVSACRAAAASTGLDARRLGTLEEWKERWLAALNGDHDAACPIRGCSGVDAKTVATPEIVVIDAPSASQAGGHAVNVSTSSIIRDLKWDLSKLEESLPKHSGVLVAMNGPSIGTQFFITKDVTTIGRDPESDIWLNDPTVSRRHAAIFREGDRFAVRDEGSSNGTLLNHRYISTEASLSAYEELGIAEFQFLFIQSTDMRKLRQRQRFHLHSRLIEDVSAGTSPLSSRRPPED